MDLSIHTVICLDKVQKKIALTKEEHNLLKEQGLIEGRFPNVFVASHVAKVTGEKAKTSKTRHSMTSITKNLLLSLYRNMGAPAKMISFI
jgi:ATP-dependent DNA helicase RecG